MTRLEAQKYLPEINALAEGKLIQYYDPVIKCWIDVDNPNFFSHAQYRIKPQPREIVIPEALVDSFITYPCKFKAGERRVRLREVLE